MEDSDVRSKKEKIKEGNTYRFHFTFMSELLRK
jgi:hypothetical protein